MIKLIKLLWFKLLSYELVSNLQPHRSEGLKYSSNSADPISNFQNLLHLVRIY